MEIAEEVMCPIVFVNTLRLEVHGRKGLVQIRSDGSEVLFVIDAIRFIKID